MIRRYQPMITPVKTAKTTNWANLKQSFHHVTDYDGDDDGEEDEIEVKEAAEPIDEQFSPINVLALLIDSGSKVD